MTEHDKYLIPADYLVTLGELEVHCTYLPDSLPVIINGDTHKFAGHLDSYRGYYDQIAICPADDPCNVAKLAFNVRAAIGSEFEGYKGGQYTMTRLTPVWVSPYGHCSGMGLVAVRLYPSFVNLVVEKVD